MSRWLALAAVVLLAGCIQIQVDSSGFAAPDAAAPADAGPADHYPVTCRLLDENGSAVRDGTCTYSFGALGAEVHVDRNGSAVRNVPAGLDGKVGGSAPGRAGAAASLSITGPKVVRITLPKLPRSTAPASHPQSGGGNATAPASPKATDASNGTIANATTDYTSVRDLVFQQTYANVPGDPPAVQEYTFTLDPKYQEIELEGSYVEPYAYAAYTVVDLYGPDGKVAAHYEGIDANAVAEGTGGGVSFPMGIVLPAAPGEYRVSLSGAGLPALQVSAYGLSGLARDVQFTDLPSGEAEHLNGFVGKVVILDLMASWCPPCNAAMPGLTAVRDHYGGKVEVLSVDVDPSGDPPEDLRAFIAKHQVTWPIGFEAGSSADDAYGTGWIPTMVLVDQHGRLLYRHIGEIDQAELRDRIDAALAAG